MDTSNFMFLFYVKARRLLKSFLFLLFSENSKIINLFVNFDVFFRKFFLFKNSLKGEFNFDGLKFLHDKSDTSVASSVLINGTYEPELLNEIYKTLKTGYCFIDGGANIGFFSLIASKIVGQTGTVISFEPTPLTHTYLKKNININNASNITISKYGLSSSKKQLPFQMFSNPEGNSIISNKVCKLTDENEIIQIKTISIDEFCKENKISRIDLIKLDIEGQELEAIKGAKKVLSENHSIKIIFELNIAGNKHGIDFAKKIFDELIKLNFSNFQTLLNPRNNINDLNDNKNVKLLKKITDRHNVNILATR